MADFFDKPDEQVGTQEEVKTEEPAKIKLGDAEYSQEELQAMIGLAGKVKDYEKNSGTNFDKLTSEFGKRAQTIGELRKKLEDAEKKKIEEKVENKQELSEEEAVRQAQMQADKLGIVTKASISRYITETLEARDLLDTCKDLAEEINGKDGRPAFNTEEILTYMREIGFRNPIKAYKDKYEKEIDVWKEQQLSKKKPSGLVTEESSTAGGKEPSKVKVTRDNLEQVIKESLLGGKE